MAKAPNPPTSLLQAVAYFSDAERAFDFVKSLRWPDGVVTCPRCEGTRLSFLTTRRLWKCLSCKRQFSLKVGTVFEDSPIGFEKWLPAMWLLANSKNSVSSHELARALGVTQKTAWFMFHRIRLAMATGTWTKLSGTVEVDETYIGPKALKMHKWRRQQVIHGPLGGKTPVQGAIERGGTVRAEMIPDRYPNLKKNVETWVEAGTTVYTDKARGYQTLGQRFTHETVTHGNEYVRGDVHTNTLENFWSLLKRALKGTQVHVAPAHLDRYVAERVFAYNNRTDSDLTRMRKATQGIAGKRLTWAELTK